MNEKIKQELEAQKLVLQRIGKKLQELQDEIADEYLLIDCRLKKMERLTDEQPAK